MHCFGEVISMMRKIVAEFLVCVLALSMLAGCGKKEKQEEAVQETKEENVAEIPEEKAPELKLGAYCQEITDEMEGETVSYKYYILIQEGGKGFMLTQDDVIISWDDKTISSEGAGSYTYEIKDGGVLVLKDENAPEIEQEFKYIGEKLPADVEENMLFYIDGTPKVTNWDAANAFDYMLTADTIDFYDYSGDVAYSASDEEIDTLGAAYFELTDRHIPVLLISTPYAIHAVGYEHVLQYVDGRIRDVVGLDKIVALYEKAGVFAATWQGGGYGEVNYYYYYVDANGDIVNGAYVSIMEDEEYAALYKENFGQDFQPMYYLYDSDGNQVKSTQEEFEAWLSGLIGDEEPITEIKWKNVKDVF